MNEDYKIVYKLVGAYRITFNDVLVNFSNSEFNENIVLSVYTYNISNKYI